VVFVLAFGESLAVVSLLLPATAILLGIGGLVGASGVAIWPIWLAAVLGASAGDWVSYGLGMHFKESIVAVWPLSRYPDVVARGRAFFHGWGWAGIFLGRFFGPLRCIVPLAAGIAGMPWVPFQLANVASAIVWATGILAPGAIAALWLF
jgi:membrane protein DedA with SNARE-associated domain